MGARGRKMGERERGKWEREGGRERARRRGQQGGVERGEQVEAQRDREGGRDFMCLVPNLRPS
eukprot:5466564-Pleurochrysis_carterae.AAC.1